MRTAFMKIGRYAVATAIAVLAAPASALAETTTGLSHTLQLSGGGTAGTQWSSERGWMATNYIFEDPAAVPEPASLLMLGTGLAAIGGLRRRLRAQRSKRY